MQNDLPLVSLITVNFNALDDTEEFISTALNLSYINTEIIVVDNGSHPSKRPNKSFQEKFPQVLFIQSDINLGFAGGNNIGIKKAKGDYLFFLNNDTLLYPGFLEPIISFMQSHSHVGMASPKVLYPDESTIQYAGAVGINPYTGRGKRIGLFEKDSGQYDSCYNTDLGHGAALIVPKRVIDLIGPMPEIYFLYYEEHDWCEQLKRTGNSMHYLGISKIIHKESVSTGGSDSPLKTYYLNRNRLLFMRRNYSGIKFFIGLLFFLCISIPIKSFKFLAAGKVNSLRSLYRGLYWNLTNDKS